jgi:hypothetical protein
LIKSQVLYHLSYGLAGAGVEARAGPVNSGTRMPRARRADPRRAGGAPAPLVARGYADSHLPP